MLELYLGVQCLYCYIVSRVSFGKEKVIAGIFFSILLGKKSHIPNTRGQVSFGDSSRYTLGITCAIKCSTRLTFSSIHDGCYTLMCCVCILDRRTRNGKGEIANLDLSYLLKPGKHITFWKH